MPKFNKRNGRRGFSLIELMFAMGILGLVLSLTLAEFITAFGHFSFAQTHMDAEMAGRVAMAKVNDVLQLASSDHNPADVPAACSTHCMVVANKNDLAWPGPISDVAVVVTTNDVTDSSGQLSAGMKTVAGVPEPDYQVVELKMDNVLQQITETRTSFKQWFLGGLPTSTAVLARNVQSFNVTALNWDGAKGFCSGFQVNIQTVGPAQGGRHASVANTSNTVYFTSYAGFQ
jgi:prepilin-type N-terminal cleavage/methylation domain-containing protein